MKVAVRSLPPRPRVVMAPTHMPHTGSVRLALAHANFVYPVSLYAQVQRAPCVLPLRRCILRCKQSQVLPVKCIRQRKLRIESHHWQILCKKIG
jgi:hypothetical protein